MAIIDMDAAIDQAVEEIERLCEPARMSKAEAVEFLESVIDRCRASLEALREEIANASDDGEATDD